MFLWKQNMNTFMIKTEIFCTIQFEGIHSWPNCPIEEVKYLRDPHRHIFFITAHKEVSHNDRDVEFIWLKHRIEEYLKETYPNNDLGSTSCEMLANELASKFDLMKCKVSEDNENGAIVKRTQMGQLT